MYINNILQKLLHILISQLNVYEIRFGQKFKITKYRPLMSLIYYNFYLFFNLLTFIYIFTLL